MLQGLQQLLRAIPQGLAGRLGCHLPHRFQGIAQTIANQLAAPHQFRG